MEIGEKYEYVLNHFIEEADERPFLVLIKNKDNDSVLVVVKEKKCFALGTLLPTKLVVLETYRNLLEFSLKIDTRFITEMYERITHVKAKTCITKNDLTKIFGELV